MFRMEGYRILSRKVGLAAMAVSLLTVWYFALGNTIWGEGLIDEGRIYYGAGAIARDMEIAAEFAGPLTEDTVRAIWEKYGPPVNCAQRNTSMEGLEAAAKTGGSDNYCNRFVAERFGQQVQGEDGRATYVLAEGWTESAYLSGEYIFGYTGSREYWDRFLLAYVLAHISIIVLLSPMFSEDYAYRTADIILPTAKGRLALWARRMGVACALASVCFLLPCGSVFLEHVACYGAEGLGASSWIAGLPVFFGKGHVSMGEVLAALYLGGWLSSLIVAALTCAVSACCRHSFSSLVRSLLLYIGPYIFMKLVLDGLPVGFVNILLHYFCYSFPFSYPGMFLEAPDKDRLFMTAIALSIALLGAALGANRYCRHQVK